MQGTNFLLLHWFLQSATTLQHKDVGILLQRKKPRFFDVAEPEEGSERAAKRQKIGEEKEQVMSTQCPEHGKLLTHFCMEYMRVLCEDCLSTQEHSSHAADTHLVSVAFDCDSFSGYFGRRRGYESEGQVRSQSCKSRKEKQEYS